MGVLMMDPPSSIADGEIPELISQVLARTSVIGPNVMEMDSTRSRCSSRSMIRFAKRRPTRSSTAGSPRLLRPRPGRDRQGARRAERDRAAPGPLAGAREADRHSAVTHSVVSRVRSMAGPAESPKAWATVSLQSCLSVRASQALPTVGAMTDTTPTTLIVLGASGDLTSRLLLPCSSSWASSCGEEASAVTHSVVSRVRSMAGPAESRPGRLRRPHLPSAAARARRGPGPAARAAGEGDRQGRGRSRAPRGRRQRARAAGPAPAGRRHRR
jgi:hypothetical protein